MIEVDWVAILSITLMSILGAEEIPDCVFQMNDYNQNLSPCNFN